MMRGLRSVVTQERRARRAALVLAVVWVSLLWTPLPLPAQSEGEEAEEAQATSFDAFLALLKTDEPRVVLFRWREPVELDGREQTLTGEQVRLESSGEIFTVYYDGDGVLLEEFSARNQRRWPGGDVAATGEKPTLQQAQAAAAQPKPLPPTGALFTDDAGANPAFSSQPILAPGLRDPRRPFVMRSRRAKVDPQALIDFSPVTGRTLKIDLFRDASVEAQFSRLHMNATGSFILGGQVVGDPLSDVTMSVDGNAVAGRVRSPEQGLFLLRGSANGGVEVTQVDATQFEDCGSDPNLSVPSVATASLVGTGGAGGAADSIAAHEGIGESHVLEGIRGDLHLDSPALGAGGVTMDLLVVFTNKALAKVASFIVGAGGEIDGFTDSLELMRALIHMEVFDANTAYLNSGVKHRLRLVHIRQNSYVESGNSLTDLINLNDNEPLEPPSPDLLDELHAYRNAYGADLVHLVTSPTVPDVCGIAQVSGPFGITLVDCFGIYVLAHEIGHNQGCAHDRGNNPVGAGPTEQTTGRFSYSYGQVFKGNSGNLFETIMAQTLLSPLGPIPHFSNPDVLFDGRPTGVAIGQPLEASNAATINSTGPGSSSNRSTVLGRQVDLLSSIGFAGAGAGQAMTLGLLIDQNRFVETVTNGPGVMKKVLIRGRGPGLAALGLGTVVGDPKLTLVQHVNASTVTLAQNNDWKDSQEAEITATGLQPTDDNEAAIVTYLAPGRYSVRYEVEGGSDGFGAVEAYILDDWSMSSKPHVLSNLGNIDTGHEQITAEFQVEGPAPSNIVIRGRGRSLASESASDTLTDANTMADPTLEVYSGPTLLASNDDWFETQLARITEVNARPEHDRDAAIRLYLQPGIYRAVMKRFGTTLPGAGILEVMDVNNFSARLGSPNSGLVDFGSLTEGQSIVRPLDPKTKLPLPYSYTFTITSTGAGTMVIPAFSGQMAGGFRTPRRFPASLEDFTNWGDVPITLPTGASVSIPFEFYSSGQGTGLKTRNIVLLTNDMGNPQITITLKANIVALPPPPPPPGGGAGGYSGLFVTPTTLAWGKVALGKVVTKTVRIQNYDSVPRQINAFSSQFTSKDKYFSTTAGKTAIVLSPGAFVDIPFTYKAMKVGTTTKKTVKLTTSDPALPTVSIQLSASTVMTF